MNAEYFTQGTDESFPMFKKTCFHCKGISLIHVDKQKMIEWNEGRLIQSVWPNESADLREVMITGTHPECWNEMFAEEGE